MNPNATRNNAIADPLIQRDINPSHSFTLGGHAYDCHPLQPLEQVHIARRLAPLVVGALKPEGGRAVILQRLAQVAGLGTSEADTPAATDQIADAAMDLAVSVLEAAAEIDEEIINDIIRKCMAKVWRKLPSGGKQTLWYAKLDRPSFPDIDGFTTLAIVGNYLVGEFRGRVTEYIASLDLKPGPAFARSAGGADVAARPPNAPTARPPRKPGEAWVPPTLEEAMAEARG